MYFSKFERRIGGGRSSHARERERVCEEEVEKVCEEIPCDELSADNIVRRGEESSDKVAR